MVTVSKKWCVSESLKSPNTVTYHGFISAFIAVIKRWKEVQAGDCLYGIYRNNEVFEVCRCRYYMGDRKPTIEGFPSSLKVKRTL